MYKRQTEPLIAFYRERGLLRGRGIPRPLPRRRLANVRKALGARLSPAYRPPGGSRGSREQPAARELLLHLFPRQQRLVRHQRGGSLLIREPRLQRATQIREPALGVLHHGQQEARAADARPRPGSAATIRS